MIRGDRSYTCSLRVVANAVFALPIVPTVVNCEPNLVRTSTEVDSPTALALIVGTMRLSLQLLKVRLKLLIMLLPVVVWICNVLTV